MKTKSNIRWDPIRGIPRKLLLPLIIAVCASKGTITAQTVTTTYDGSYRGSYSGEVACVVDPPVPPAFVPPTPFQFTVTAGVVTIPGITGQFGHVDAFGNMNMQIPVPGVGAVTFTGIISFTGYVNNGTWALSGLPSQCSCAGPWSATFVPPPPTYVPQLTEFPSPSSLFSNIDPFIVERSGEFSPDSREYVRILDEETKPLTDPSKQSFLKTTAAGSAQGIHDACDVIGLIMSSTEEIGAETALAAFELVIPYLPLTEEQRTTLENGLFTRSIIQGLFIDSDPIGVLVDLNLYIYDKMVVPQLQQVANDPADPNYRSVAAPNPVQVPHFPSTGNAALDAAVAKNYLDVLLAQSYLGAANTAFNRYSSAYAASDATSAGLQLEALLDNLSRYDRKMQDSAADLTALQPLLVAAGSGDRTFNAQRLTNLQASIAANGLPPEVTDLLTNAGITTAQIQAAQAQALAIDPNTISGTLFGAMNNVADATRHASSNPPTHLHNISTRDSVQTGDNVMIGGFIVQGIEPKTVIVRAIGPELTQYHVPNALVDPTLELHDGTGALIASNDDWQHTVIGAIISGSQVRLIQNSGELTPLDPRESVIVATLSPGNYTAIVRGKNNTTGVALVEVYDLSSRTNSLLGNISTRGFVQTGDSVMIGGLIIRGTTPKRVIVRVIGPELTQYGVPSALADPTLELHDGTGALIASNDDWIHTIIGGVITANQVSGIRDSGHAPTDGRESAIIADLPAGNYTAIVRGANNTTGVALVEVYDLD